MDLRRSAAWTADASDGVKASARVHDWLHGRALRLDFDLGKSAGYAFVHRKLPLDLPENYEISFNLRANAPVNNFEVKLADASGDNVWWFQRPDFVFPSEWRRIRIKKRQITFAWGPTEDRTLRRIDSLEFVVAAGRGGGGGSIEIDDLRFRELPPPPTHFPPLEATASSSLSGAEPGRAVDGDARTSWRSDPTGRIRANVSTSILAWCASSAASNFAGKTVRGRAVTTWRLPATALPGRCCGA